MMSVRLRGGQGLLPEVVSAESLGVGRVAGASVVALVEGQEDGLLAGKLGAEAGPVLVDSHVDGAAPWPEDVLAGVPVMPVLLDCVLHGLLGEVVLELEGEYGQPVDEERQVQGEARVFRAVVHLPGYREAVPGIECRGHLVARGGSAVEEPDGVLAVLDAVSEDVDDAAVPDLPVEAPEELPAGVVIGVQLEGLGGLRLGVVQKGRQMGEVHA